MILESLDFIGLEKIGLELLHTRLLTVFNVFGIAENAEFKLLEPEKCHGWEWVNINDVVNKKPLFPVLEEVLKTVDLEDILMLRNALIG